MLIALALACKPTPAPADDTAPIEDTGPAATGDGHLRVHPDFVVLEPGETWTLTAEINGEPVQASFESSDAGQVAVDGETVRATQGAALITATFDGQVSPPVTVIVADMVDGVVWLTDDQIGPVTVLDDLAVYAPGYQYDLEIDDAELDIGDMVVARETKPIAGRVVSWDGRVARIEATSPSAYLNGADFELSVPLGQLEPDLSGLGDYDVVWDTDGSLTATPKDRANRALTCGAGITLVPATSGIDLKNELELDASWTGLAPEKAVIQGQFTVKAGYTAGISELEAKAECNLMFKRKYVFKGIFSIFPQPATQLGIGVSGLASTTIYDSGTELALEAVVTPKMGYDCSGAECVFHTDWDSEVSVTEPKVTAPGWADEASPVTIELDNYTRGLLLFSSSIGEQMEGFPVQVDTEVVLQDMRGGTRISGTLQTPDVQARRTDFRAHYAFGGFNEWEFIPGGVELLGGLFEVKLVETEWAYDYVLDHSPHGTFVTAAEDFEPDVPVVFDIALDEVVFLEALDFGWDTADPSFYNVSELVIYRVETDSETGDVIALVEEDRLAASDGQTSWEWTWTPTQDDQGTVRFTAFVDTAMVPGLELEVSDHATLTLSSCRDELVNGDLEDGPSPWLAYYGNSNVSTGWSWGGTPITAQQGSRMLNVGWPEGASTVGGLAYQVLEGLPAGEYELDLYYKVATDTHNVDFSGSCADKIPKLFIAVGEYTVTSFAEFDYTAETLYCDKITTSNDAYQVATTDWHLLTLPVTVPYDTDQGIVMLQVYDGYSQWAHWVVFDDMHLLGECESE